MYGITLSSVNTRLIRETFVSDQKMIWYSVNAREKEHFVSDQKVIRYSVNARDKEHFCIGSKSDPVQCKREGKGTLLYRIKK